MMISRGVTIFVVAFAALLVSGAAQAQVVDIAKKTDFSLLLNADLQQSVSGIGISQGTLVRQSATDSGGFLAGLRYHFNPLLSVEANYGYTQNSQDYVTGVSTASIRSGVHFLTGAAVATAPFHIFGLRPYALVGGGGIFYRPTGDTNASVGGEITQVKPTAVYGAGVDFSLIPHLSIRGEYRGYFLKAPDFGFSGLATGKFTQLAQPSIGVVFHF